MELLKYICIGDRADIVVPNIDDKEKAKNYSSKLIEIEKNKIIKMEAPISGGILVPLKVGANYKIHFYSKGNIYLVKTKLLNRQKATENGLSSLKFEITSEVEKIQRRTYFRFECSIDCKIKPIVDEEENENKDQYVNCLVKDLSAGGLRFLSNIDIDEGSKVECVIKLNEHELSITGKIVRNLKSDNKNYKKDLGLRFIYISDQNRDMIQKYIFDQQRKLRKKGMM